LTLHDANDANPVKRYVVYTQDMQPLLNALLDIFKVCKRARTHPLSPPNLTTMVTNHRKDTQYYLMERLNHDYREDAVGGIHHPFQEQLDRVSYLPLCVALLGALEGGLIIGHPEIPLREGAWRHDDTDLSNPHILMRMDGTEENFLCRTQTNLPGLFTTDNVGIMTMPNDLHDIAEMLVARLQHLVGATFSVNYEP
jgi:hypothetical protein